MTPALELRRLTAAYGRIEVLRGVDLIVPPGAVFALLGPNGAGKTSTLKAIDGRLRPTGGCMHVGGVHVNGWDAASLSRAGLCSVPEGSGVFPNLTVADNLRMATYGVRDASLADVQDRAFARFPVLGQRRTQLAGTLSGGEQQMLAMARALVVDPAVLLVDEPSMGLAPLIVAELYQVLAQLARTGLAIVVVEQFARTALAIADFGAVMVQGRIAHLGEPGDLEEILADAYLGGAA